MRLGGFGLPEMLILLAIIVLFVGARKIPGLARSLGTSIQEFKKGARGEGEGEELEQDSLEASKSRA
jgi:sec-independent protein translocase protein TatA